MACAPPSLGHLSLTGWEMAHAPAPPDTLDVLKWLPATVPGTAAEALLAAGQGEPGVLATLHQRHVWVRTRLPRGISGTLHLEGLAGHCDIWLDGTKRATSRSMFVPVDLPLDAGKDAELLLHFQPMTVENGMQLRRQRWRPHLIEGPHLRQWRISLLGHMPGWCPRVPPVGPYRPVTLIPDTSFRISDLRILPRVDGWTGVLDVSLVATAATTPPVLHCAGHAVPMRAGNGRWAATLHLPKVALWWPHTHGDPVLHGVEVETGGARHWLGRTGFRRLEVDRGADGRSFRLLVNGIPVFCRGATWVPLDVTSLQSPHDALAARLAMARDAGMNMLRVPGITTYEPTAFHDLCDELGILVWQDLMLANFDYDMTSPEWCAALEAEIEALLDRAEGSPSLAVLCGGSEMMQQGAMLSLPEAIWRKPFLETDLPALVAARRPDLIAVPNSPSGGDLPFRTDEGVTHYFGVGAYKRPLEDARRADVRFAAECLAFAQLPQPERLAEHSGGAAPGAPGWRDRVVRDLKADWDFEDTRDHYLGLLYGVDSARLKTQDAARYLALSSAVSGEVMEHTIAEWRRTGSGCGGALVLSLADVQPGFGWGVIDSEGFPKPAYHALKRAFRPLSLAMTDEGLNGLDIHILNEGPMQRNVRLTLAAYGADGATVIDGQQMLTVPPCATLRRSSTDILGMFFDITAAYGFGAPAHVVSCARLEETASGERLAEAFHFPLGRAAAMADPGLSAGLQQEAEGWVLHLEALRLAQSVHITAPGFLPEDDWFHLPPGIARRIRLVGEGTPCVSIQALNSPPVTPLR